MMIMKFLTTITFLSPAIASTCGELKSFYQDSDCCGNSPTKPLAECYAASRREQVFEFPANLGGLIDLGMRYWAQQIGRNFSQWGEPVTVDTLKSFPGVAVKRCATYEINIVAPTGAPYAFPIQSDFETVACMTTEKLSLNPVMIPNITFGEIIGIDPDIPPQVGFALFYGYYWVVVNGAVITSHPIIGNGLKMPAETSGVDATINAKGMIAHIVAPVSNAGPFGTATGMNLYMNAEYVFEFIENTETGVMELSKQQLYIISGANSADGR